MLCYGQDSDPVPADGEVDVELSKLPWLDDSSGRIIHMYKCIYIYTYIHSIHIYIYIYVYVHT